MKLCKDCVYMASNTAFHRAIVSFFSWKPPLKVMTEASLTFAFCEHPKAGQGFNVVTGLPNAKLYCQTMRLKQFGCGEEARLFVPLHNYGAGAIE